MAVAVVGAEAAVEAAVGAEAEAVVGDGGSGKRLAASVHMEYKSLDQ
ncbi:hypothetical protein LBYZC6_54670 [Lacrimispora brassicae]